jgi:hypothetical protein
MADHHIYGQVDMLITEVSHITRRRGPCLSDPFLNHYTLVSEDRADLK